MSRLSLLNFGLRHIGRPLLARTKSPQQAAKDFRRTARFAFLRPRGLKFERLDRSLARITCGPVNDSAGILYFHGGGYVAGSAWTHRAMLGRLSLLSGLPVFAADYRLAQDAPFPAAFDDARAAWDKIDLPAACIVLGGDSAGGGLSLALLASLLNDGIRPAGSFAFSPWTDLTLSGETLTTNAASDAILPRARMDELRETVLQGADPADPRISPLFAEWTDPPPVLVQASDTEILYDDGRRITERLKQAGSDATFETWSNCPHVWHIFDGLIP
ncbi:MAG: alpha/beta hydrolase fold domain-containing protein, partial [Pseudomonadota bacterium]